MFSHKYDFVGFFVHSWFLLLSIGMPGFLYGQNAKYKAINLNSSYVLELPGGDLKERFGLSYKFEFNPELQFGNHILFLSSAFRFGENVNEDPLAPIRTEEGFVIGVNGFYADVFGRKRGFEYGLGYGLNWALSPKFENLKIRTGFAIKRLHHWIRIFDESMAVPQLSSPYDQIFDRFTRGIGIEENIQLQYSLGKNRAGFLIGFQFAQGFTKDLRSSEFFIPNENRLDLYFGLKLSYQLPIYKFEDPETIFY